MRRNEGFSLVELLVGAVIMTIIAGAAFMMLGPAKELLRVQPERSEVLQRLRVTVEAVQRELVMAGAGASMGRAVGPLSYSVAFVLPYRSGDRNDDAARGIFYRPDTISILYVPPTTAQASVKTVAALGEGAVIHVEPNCGDAHDRLCGFRAGMQVLLFDALGRFATGSVSSIVGTTVTVDGITLPGGVDVDRTATLVEVTQHTYWLDLAATVPRLMHYDGQRTDSPVVDNVVALAFEYFGAAQPPMRLPGVDLDAEHGPWTTYGPKPPPIGHDDPSDSWPAGESCIFSVDGDAHVPRLAALAGGSVVARLEQALFVDGPWCPDATHPRRFDADLLRIRRVRMTVRVQAGSASLRGRAGRWFSREGIPVSAHGLIPDEEIRVDVSPRNVNATP